mmetsp:Transcript_19634/g.57949  ORF Transcript_19634/g.57949 Transcript_19634/m.57949 type:complete len:234 (+) Transcript_19634:174-875(+)
MPLASLVGFPRLGESEGPDSAALTARVPAASPPDDGKAGGASVSSAPPSAKAGSSSKTCALSATWGSLSSPRSPWSVKRAANTDATFASTAAALSSYSGGPSAGEPAGEESTAEPAASGGRAVGGGRGKRSTGGVGGGILRGHQFLAPSSPMTLGTSTVRTRNVSTSTETVRRKASSLREVLDEKSKAPKAIAMITPAAEMSGPLCSTPEATDSRSVYPARRYSRTRPRRKMS